MASASRGGVFHYRIRILYTLAIIIACFLLSVQSLATLTEVGVNSDLVENKITSTSIFVSSSDEEAEEALEYQYSGKKHHKAPGEILRLGKSGVESDWLSFLAAIGRPTFMKETTEDKLEQINQLAPHPASGHPDLSKVCLTNECLDSALALLKSINFSVDPCQDFYEYSCGRWRAENPIPPTYSRWGQFSILRDKVNNVTQDILAAPPNASDFKPMQQSQKYFKQCNDLATLNARGVKPLLQITEEFGGWPAISKGSWDPRKFDLVYVLGEIGRRFSDSFIVSAYVSADLKNTTRSVIYLDQPDFFLDRSILLNASEYKERIQAYEDYFVGVATLLAQENGVKPNNASLRAQAKDVIAFETKLASFSSKDEDRTDVNRTYNPRKLNKYEQSENKFPWKRYLDLLFKSSGVSIKPDEDLVVSELEYLKSAKNLIDTTNKTTVANYVQWRLVAGLASQTTDKMRELAFNFNLANGGSKVMPPRRKTCANIALNAFGMAIGVKYVEQVFDVNAKKNVDLMVENLRSSFLALLDANQWMDKRTKENARTKLHAIRQFMAFPDWLFNKTKVESEFAGYELSPTWLGSVIGFSTWIGDFYRKRLRKRVDKEEWHLGDFPPVVNAFYSPEYNSITFPAGILAPPFYRSNGPEFLNYGGIGLVIGHEITHGFDDQGSQFDAYGNAVNWWTNETLAQFNEKAKCFMDQYSNYTVTVKGDAGKNKTYHVNGNLTAGENIADNGGMRESYQAYRTWVTKNNKGVEEKRLPGLEFLSPNQLYYLGFANVWCENINDGALVNQLLGDPHSPGRYRVLGPLQNSQTFAQNWNCPAGSPMNPKGQQKCLLW